MTPSSFETSVQISTRVAKTSWRRYKGRCLFLSCKKDIAKRSRSLHLEIVHSKPNAAVQRAASEYVTALLGLF